ncbi:MAG TPA: hypothetical protein VHA37_05365 [Candidatus Saccharimonadales bacterium]|nr:hypothetical protein [Candidatus Saccharimonadales bacterium]
MAGKTISVKLSEQWQGGEFKCYKKQVGGRMVYLSRDREDSARMAMALAARWETLLAAGQGWTDEIIADVLAPYRPQMVKPTKGIKPVSLYAAIDAYLEAYKAGVSESRYQRHVTAMTAYKGQQSDCPLSAIAWDKLAATVAHFTARPKTSHGSPMAVATVQTTVKAIYALYDHLDAAGLWDAPKRFQRLFKVDYGRLRTPLEVKREGQGPDVFTVEELAALWKAATPRQRVFLGLALNIGETAQGLAALQKADLRQEGETWVVDRNRGKTGIRGVYPLWAEVRKLVEADMNKNADEPLLFKSADGKPLVWFGGTWRVDSVAKTWSNLLDHCPKVRRLSHKHLRKTGASLIEHLTGSDRVAELYLSHSGNSVAKKHYLARDFDRLAEGLAALRAHLSPMFDGTETVKGEEGEAKAA